MDEGKIPGKAERQAQMIDLAQQLLSEIEDLGNKSGDQFVSLARRARTNRQLIVLVIIGGLLDIVLTVAMIFAMVGMQHNTDRIDMLTKRLDNAQTVQRQKALCPLYQIFLDSKSPQGRKAAPDPKKYDHAFVVIKQGYDALECDQFITNTPPPVSPAPRS